MGKRANAKRREQTQRPDPRIDATGERYRHNEITTQGTYRRIVPPIDMLRNRDAITMDEWERLNYYRQQGSLADKSSIKDSLDYSVGGGSGNGPGVAITSAVIETGRIERDLGALRAFVRRIVVDDWTLARWCIAQYGGRERLDSVGRWVAIVPNNEKRVIALALFDLKYASGMITMR
jgi:hypothetical protein